MAQFEGQIQKATTRLAVSNQWGKRAEDASLTTFARTLTSHPTLSLNTTNMYCLLFPLHTDQHITGEPSSEALPY